jgi:hypothetical protein
MKAVGGVDWGSEGGEVLERAKNFWGGEGDRREERVVDRVPVRDRWSVCVSGVALAALAALGVDTS